MSSVRSSIAAWVLVAILATCCPGSGRAGWTPGGVTVLASTSTLRPLAACGDGAYGTFVAWQENLGDGSALLHVQHLLGSGDLDPAWLPEGVSASTGTVSRADLALLPDRLGGVFVLWTEGSAIYLTRLRPDGIIDAGWPTRGRLIGALAAPGVRPSAIADGAHGLYAAWPGTLGVMGAHLGSDGAGVGGWPSGARLLGPLDDSPTRPTCPQLALAPDGGVFLAWESLSTDAALAPSETRLRHFTSAGLNAPGWPTTGLTFGEHGTEYPGAMPTSAMSAVSPDGRGGVFLLVTRVTAPGPEISSIETRLYRLTGDGSGAVDWPAGGRPIAEAIQFMDLGPDGSFRVMPDGVDGAIVGTPRFYSESTYNLHYDRYPADAGSGPSPLIETKAIGHEPLARGDGGLYVGSFEPDGPTSMWDANACIALSAYPVDPGWVGLLEYHTDPVVTWYGDIALAPTGDGGVVFFWSQVRERFGLFARRFSSAGEVTATPRPPATAGLGGLRFVPGEGVRAWLSLPGGEPARFELFDVGGRRVAAARFDGSVSGERDLTLAGTAALDPGLYFARLSTAHAVFRGRVVAIR